MWLNFKRKVVLLSGLMFPVFLHSQEPGSILPPWEKGEMEIHHICTGHGEGVFCIFPDGTTMLIDGGDIGPTGSPSHVNILPDPSRQPGEWIARYISKRMNFTGEKRIDYMFLTHFHEDHMGGVYENSPLTKKGGAYVLNGITEIGEYIRFGKMVDRGWPDYNYPAPLTNKTVSNYRSFVTWSIENRGLKMERFIPGSDEQFTLVHDPGSYRNLFSVRNIVANGEVWTGVGKETRHFFPEDIPGQDIPEENKCSAGIKISYGAFDYFNGGDLSGRLPANAPEWKDIETPVGKATGPVEVCEVNHHAYVDAMNESFISSLRPRVFVVQVWDVFHLCYNIMQSMLSQGLYPGKRDIFMTTIHESAKAYLGEGNLKRLAGYDGHIVIKVAPGGSSFSVLVLTATDESHRIKSIHGPYQCR